MNNRSRPLVGALSLQGVGVPTSPELVAAARQGSQSHGMGAISAQEIELIRQHRALSQRNSPPSGVGAVFDHEARHIRGAGAVSDSERSAPWWTAYAGPF